ncbi:MAG: hypothetical protein HKN17_09760, partial [Rhodothermales bacterium]|nr:hypothetical protein [Rhodothermales bacterium]
MPYPDKLMDVSDLNGGLARMVDRFKKEGTLTGERSSDAFLMENPNAVLLGMLFDQRVRAEYAFTGAERLQARLGHLDMKKIARMDLEKLQERFAEKPAVHRFVNVMAERTQGVAQVIVDEYDGDASNIWADGVDFETIRKRLMKLPGFGKMKATKSRYALHFFG